jgi:hypothetical protein
MKLFLITFCCGVLALGGIVFFLSHGGFKNVELQALLISTQTREVLAECISTFSDKNPELFSIAKTHLDDNRLEDFIVTHTDGGACGSAGCIAELCVGEPGGSYRHIPFGIAAKSIEIKNTITNKMHDVTVNGNSESVFVWDGMMYRLEEVQ